MGVTTIAALEVAVGIFSLFEGALLVTDGKMAGLAIDTKLSADIGAFGVLISILGLFALLASYGVWNRKRWAWTYSVMICGLGILTNITAFFFGLTISVLCAGLEVIVIFYLTRPDVRAYFPKLYPTTGK